MSTLSNPLRRFRRPEYTGENRCVPCTLVNVVLAALVSLTLEAAVGTVWPTAPGPTAVLGVAVFAACLAVIYLRGYLVPGTPTLTKRYFPDRVLRWFEKAPAETADAVGEVDVESFLVRTGVLEECADADDLCLTDEFRRDWRDRIETVRASGGDLDLATFMSDAERDAVDEADLEVERYGDAVVARLDGRRLAQWESEAATVADRAAAVELEGRTDEWADLGFEARTQVTGALRLWLDRCPDCEGAVSLGQETVESCCRAYDVVAVSCETCDSRLFEMEYDGAGGQAAE